MTLEKQSPCKVNLLLNILGKRADGFHELETVMHPVALCDQITVTRKGNSISLTCNDARLPVDATNLVHRAATAFLKAAGVSDGVAIHLEKRIPMEAGLGGGSGNAATTLLGLNELFGRPLEMLRLHELAAGLGSDVPFFLQEKPALAKGRGERVTALDFFPALKGTGLLLIHPGFGVATSWAYANLARFPEALNGRKGRAEGLVRALQGDDLKVAAGEFYNSLEAPVLDKYPLLQVYQESVLQNGASVALMSGSGSTTFAIFPTVAAARQAKEQVRAKFSPCWTYAAAMVGAH